MNKDKVLIFDTTLRDGEQAAPASLSVEQKLRIARQLARLGVDVIEAGFPISSPGDFESVSTIAREIKDGPAVCGLARLVEKDIVSCAEAVKPAQRPRIHTFIGTSAIHTEKKLRKSEDDVLTLIRDSVMLARRLCADVEFSAEDAGRTDWDYLCRVVETAISAGASTINIPDTVGYTTPEQFGAIIDMLFNRVPNIDKAVISVHCHNDLGMATANSLTAIAHGARQVECTINGIGERAGNAALEEIVMALKLRGDFFKVHTGINTREIMKTSKLVREICNMPVQPNKAIVGKNAFAHSSGIHQDGVLKAPETYEIMTPESVGDTHNRMKLTGRSGSHMVTVRLAELAKEGCFKSEYDMQLIYPEFKKLADINGTIYDDDLVALVKLGSAEKVTAGAYELGVFNMSNVPGDDPTSNSIDAVVHLCIAGNEKKALGSGKGTFSAAKAAIDSIVKYEIEIDDFKIIALDRSEGQNAMAKATIRASSEYGSFVGNAVDIDIARASLLAYIGVINRITRMKELGCKVPKRTLVSQIS
jgi:2-isopropylmalate synthase